jgi:dUTP pyrophosphatase
LEGGKTPEVATSRSVGFDLSAAEDVTIGAQSHKLIRLGLIISPPTDMWLMLAARSSLIKRGLILANGIGVVDPDYCGPEDELKLSVFNVTDKTVEVKQGERLAQGMFMPFPPSFTWQHVDRDDIQPDSRGGFGSTGL